MRSKIEFTLPDEVKSFNITGPRYDGAAFAWLLLTDQLDVHGMIIHAVNASHYAEDGSIQTAVDQAYAKCLRILETEQEARRNKPAPKPPTGITVAQETADLLSLLKL